MTACDLPRRAIVLAADRWHVDFLGVYGNDWIETPALQQLAAEGVVFDAHFAATLEPTRAASAWWSGRVPVERVAGGTEEREAGRDDFAVIDRLNAAGVHTVLLVENPQDRPGVVVPPFAEVVTVEAADELDAPESQMPWARLVQRAEEWLRANEGREGPALLWLWTRGVPVPWLPPREFADLYLEDFGLALPEPAGPAPVAGLTPEPLLLPEELEEEEGTELVAWAEEEDLTTDQDRIPEEVRFALALYASYASVLDRWLGRLLRQVEASPGWRDSLLVFTAALGQAVFEPPGSARAGELVPEEASNPCRGEVLQTPLILRLPAAGQLPAAEEGNGQRETGSSGAAGAEASGGEAGNAADGPIGNMPGGNVPGGTVTGASLGNVGRELGDQRGTRRRGLVSTIDLGPTLCEWLGVLSGGTWEGRSVWPMIRQECDGVHSELVTTLCDGGWALRTPDYLLVEEPAAGLAAEAGARGEEGGLVRLHEKPVDRWDVADVAREQPGVVDELQRQLRERRQAMQQLGERGG